MACSDVPKFGEWDNENTPYSTYFENAARKEKDGIRMSPNDPEKNPGALVRTRGGQGSNRDGQPLATGSSKSNLAGKHYGDGQGRQNGTNRSSAYDHQKTEIASSHRRMASESGSEKSNSDHSLARSTHRHAYSSQKKASAGGSSFSSSVSGQSTATGISNQFDGNSDKHHRTASIPKFGEWDETDPISGERFTGIFNKVKEEKNAPSFNFPTVPPQPSYNQSKNGSPSWLSKICRCLSSHGSD